MSARLKLLLLAAALAVAACAGSGKKPDAASEWEQRNARLLSEVAPDAVPPLPAYPSNDKLLPFFLSAASDFKFFVDPGSIRVEGPEVRYTLVARSPSGVDNVSFEGLQCKEREFRSYARGTAGGGWIARPTPWRRIEPRVHLAQYALHWEYLCPNNAAVYTAAEGISALQKGGHPWAKMPSSAGGAGAR